MVPRIPFVPIPQTAHSFAAVAFVCVKETRTFPIQLLERSSEWEAAELTALYRQITFTRSGDARRRRKNAMMIISFLALRTRSLRLSPRRTLSANPFGHDRPLADSV
jgi:hypothetical protein